MPEEKTRVDRVAAYSDAVFAVIVTIPGPGAQSTGISRHSRSFCLYGQRPSAMW